MTSSLEAQDAATSIRTAALPASGRTALLTDHYELTMLRAALESGAAKRPAVFEVFARTLPPGRRYGVVAGTGRFLDGLERFCFAEDELAALRQHGVIDEATASWLSTYRFSGSIYGLAEGEAYFPDTPVLVVEGTFAECVLLETLILSVLNHDTAIASAAARMTCAAGERPCVEMGSRRTHEEAAVAAARAAHLAGFAGTSNLEAGRRYGIPTSGTSAHAFTLAHDTERAAFAAQVATLGPGTTLLVDTYDVLNGVRTAVEVAGPELGAVRLDSGDLAALAFEVRSLLDELGATRTRIVVTSDLDEFAIAGLASAPVDSYGVGTSLVTGSGAPTAGFVYKLVARDGTPVEKRSANKRSHGGRKTVLRQYDDDGRVEVDLVTPRPEGPLDAPGADGTRPLLRSLVADGERRDDCDLEAARRHCRKVRGTLPREALQLSRGEAAVETIFERG
jgi:nicotinate phosphoribosyltransferase